MLYDHVTDPGELNNVAGEPEYMLVERELALLRVTGQGEKRVEALRLADIFRANVVDSTLNSFIFEITGTPEKVDAFADLMRPLGLSEVARTGVAGLRRGS